MGQEHLPQPRGTLREAPDFLLLDFSSLPLHMGRASAFAGFCGGRDHWGTKLFTALIPRESGPSLPAGNPSSLCVSVSYLYSGDNDTTTSHRDFANRNL